MPYYKPIKSWSNAVEQERAVKKLLQLRQKIRKEVPPKNDRETLLIATWNIREFKDNRLPESYYYIAEIMDAFDFVAVQEVSAHLEGLEKLMELLPHWDYIVTDATEGSAGGGERMAFLFDTHKVRFQHIAGEVVVPPGEKIFEDIFQFARTPFLAAFQARWFKFTICAVHIFYGSSSSKSVGMRRRIAEIKEIGRWLQRKAKNENSNYILLGDFNIEDPEHQTMKALESSGFYIPRALRDKPTDLGGTKYYDQIAFQVKDEDMLIFSKSKGKAGAFRFHDVVFKDDEMETYRDYFPPKYLTKSPEKLVKYYQRFWRTYQMSDHLLLWSELYIDFSDEYLQEIMEPASKKKKQERKESGE